MRLTKVSPHVDRFADQFGSELRIAQIEIDAVGTGQAMRLILHLIFKIEDHGAGISRRPMADSGDPGKLRQLLRSRRRAVRVRPRRKRRPRIGVRGIRACGNARHGAAGGWFAALVLDGLTGIFSVRSVALPSCVVFSNQTPPANAAQITMNTSRISRTGRRLAGSGCSRLSSGAAGVSAAAAFSSLAGFPQAVRESSLLGIADAGVALAA